jgi:hypothetical protein
MNEAKVYGVSLKSKPKGPDMKHLIYAAVVILAGAAFGIQPAQAQSGHGRWCAVINLGPGDAYWDCQYNTVEQCVPNVLAGNRGFCNYNPYFTEAIPAPTRTRKHHKNPT